MNRTGYITACRQCGMTTTLPVPGYRGRPWLCSSCMPLIVQGGDTTRLKELQSVTADVAKKLRAEIDYAENYRDTCGLTDTHCENIRDEAARLEAATGDKSTPPPQGWEGRLADEIAATGDAPSEFVPLAEVLRAAHDHSEAAWEIVGELMGQSEWNVDDADHGDWAVKMRAFTDTSDVLRAFLAKHAPKEEAKP